MYIGLLYDIKCFIQQIIRKKISSKDTQTIQIWPQIYIIHVFYLSGQHGMSHKLGGALPYVGGYQVPVNRPPFYTNLIPNDSPFFLNPHPVTPIFLLTYQILHTNCKFLRTSHAFWKLYKFCGNFNIKFSNFGLKMHFCPLNDPHFWESTSKKSTFWSPHWMTPFFNKIVHWMPPNFVLW